MHTRAIVKAYADLVNQNFGGVINKDNPSGNREIVRLLI